MQRRSRNPWTYVRGFFSNWREYDAPLATKLRLLVRNRWRGLVTLRFCCGNLGEPGC